MPKISVVMSVYDEPIEWIRTAIDSIVNQSFSDWEFIIINDKPEKSDSALLLSGYAEKDRRIRIITNEHNIGLTRSLNKGIKVARGHYIARMDADDMSLPQRFERQVEYLDNHPNILAMGSWTGTIDKNGNLLNAVCRYETDYRWVRAQFIQNSQISHPVAMFHRIINNELIQYDESVRYAQDYSLMVKILQYGEISNLPEVLFCYRKSDNQITASKKSEQQACAFKAQKKAFALFGFNASLQFQELFHKLTVQHDLNQSYDTVIEEFKSFFKNNKLSPKNALALELIYGNYLYTLKYLNSNSRIKTFVSVIKQNNYCMHILGMRLYSHLLARKIKRTI